jgi:hypothetical protein
MAWHEFDLAGREAGPMPERGLFESLGDYLRAWHLWRVIWRDAQLTMNEAAAKFDVIAERLGYAGEGLFDHGCT